MYLQIFQILFLNKNILGIDVLKKTWKKHESTWDSAKASFSSEILFYQYIR